MSDERIIILLAMLKNDLGMLHTQQDTFLKDLLQLAETYMADEGIPDIEDNIRDNGIIVMYAAYLFRKRTKDDNGMPRMLRYALNKRILKKVVVPSV